MSLVLQDSSRVIMTALENQQDNNSISTGLPPGTIFAHNTGTLTTVRHDGGIVEGEHPYILAITCGGEGFSESLANSTMAYIASAVDAHFHA